MSKNAPIDEYRLPDDNKNIIARAFNTINLQTSKNKDAPSLPMSELLAKNITPKQARAQSTIADQAANSLINKRRKSDRPKYDIVTNKQPAQYVVDKHELYSPHSKTRLNPGRVSIVSDFYERMGSAKFHPEYQKNLDRNPAGLYGHKLGQFNHEAN